MEWSDYGVCVHIRPLSDHKRIAVFFTATHGCHAGVYRHSKKMPLQVGTQCELTWKARLQEHIGQWTQLEPQMNYAAKVAQHSQQVLALSGLCALIARLLPDRQDHPEFFTQFMDTLNALTVEEWIRPYLACECALLKEVGYGMDWSQCARTSTTEGLVYVSPTTGNAVSRDGGVGYEEHLLPLPADTHWHEYLMVYQALFTRMYDRYFPHTDFPHARQMLEEALTPRKD